MRGLPSSRRVRSSRCPANYVQQNKSGCVCCSKLTQNRRYETVIYSHCWLCRKTAFRATGEIKSTSRWPGSCFPRYGSRLEADTPLLSRYHKFLVIVLPAISNFPVFETPASASWDEKEYAGSKRSVLLM